MIDNDKYTIPPLFFMIDGSPYNLTYLAIKYMMMNDKTPCPA